MNLQYTHKPHTHTHTHTHTHAPYPLCLNLSISSVPCSALISCVEQNYAGLRCLFVVVRRCGGEALWASVITFGIPLSLASCVYLRLPGMCWTCTSWSCTQTTRHPSQPHLHAEQPQSESDAEAEATRQTIDT